MTLSRDVVAIDTERLGTVYVPILSNMAMRAIMQRASELFPMPDAKEYEQPLPDALIEGDVLPAASNPEYKRAMTTVLLQRNQYLQDAIIAMLRLDDSTREEVIDVFKPELDVMRQFAVIPQADDFVAILRNIVLNVDEYSQIIQSASKAQPLSQEEIRDGMRIFRRDLSRNTTDGNSGKSDTSDLREEKPVSS